jgi:hypothetical protein
MYQKEEDGDVATLRRIRMIAGLEQYEKGVATQ